jgi:hypothetical protein
MTELSKRPGNSIKEYLDGRRKIYFKPVAYVLALSTIYFLISQLTDQNTWLSDFLSGWASGTSDTGKETEIPFILTWISNNFAYATLLLLPVFSFASYLSFLGLGRNYFEHFIINSYATGQQAIIYSLFILMRTFIDSEFVEIFPAFIAFSYAVWVFWQVFNEGNRILNILRSILSYILYFIFSTGLLLLAMGISEISN